MELIVKGKMPTCCGCCDASGTGACKAWMNHRKHLSEGIPSDCPIIGEIPDRHGRLIDEAKLRERAYAIQRRDRISFTDALAMALIEAETIVEATE